MSRFSDSSIDAGSSAVIEPSPAKMPPPPPPIRKDIPRVKAVDAVVSESSDDREPSTAEDDVDDSAAVRPASPTKDDALAAATGHIALEKATETPPSVSEADVEAIAEEEEEGPAKVAPARKARPSRGAAAKRAAPTAAATTRGRKRPSDPPRGSAGDAEAEEADAEAEPADTKAKPELTGIAATVKNRRRKVAKYA